MVTDQPPTKHINAHPNCMPTIRPFDGCGCLIVILTAGAASLLLVGRLAYLYFIK